LDEISRKEYEENYWQEWYEYNVNELADVYALEGEMAITATGRRAALFRATPTKQEAKRPHPRRKIIRKLHASIEEKKNRATERNKPRHRQQMYFNDEPFDEKGNGDASSVSRASGFLHVEVAKKQQHGKGAQEDDPSAHRP